MKGNNPKDWTTRMGDILEDFGEKPSDGVWDSLEKRLDSLPPLKAKPRRVPISVILPILGTAAVLLFGVFLFIRSGNDIPHGGKIAQSGSDAFDIVEVPSLPDDSDVTTSEDTTAGVSPDTVSRPSGRTPSTSEGSPRRTKPLVALSSDALHPSDIADVLPTSRRELYSPLPGLEGIGEDRGMLPSRDRERIPRSILAIASSRRSDAQTDPEDNSRIWADIASSQETPSGTRGTFSLDARGNIRLGAGARSTSGFDSSPHSDAFSNGIPTMLYSGSYGIQGSNGKTDTKAIYLLSPLSQDFDLKIGNPGNTNSASSRHALPLKTSLMGRYTFPGSRFSIEGGAGALWMKSSTAGGVNEEKVYVGVPVGVDFSLAGGEWWNLYLKAGAAGYALVSSRYFNSGQTGSMKESDFLYGINGGLGMEFSLPVGISVFLEPEIGWYADTNQGIRHYYSDNHAGISVNAGIRYSFSR